jgi:hypothetical protein
MRAVRAEDWTRSSRQAAGVTRRNLSGARIITIVNSFTVSVNATSQLPSGNSLLPMRSAELGLYRYKRPTLVTPLDRKLSAYFIFTAYQYLRQNHSQITSLTGPHVSEN